MALSPPYVNVISNSDTTADIFWLFSLGGPGSVTITFTKPDTTSVTYPGQNNDGATVTYTGLVPGTAYVLTATSNADPHIVSTTFTTSPSTTYGSVRVSKTAPLQNTAPCVACTNAANAPTIIQYSSASELIEYKRRKAVQQSYTNTQNMFPIRNRYASLYTTIKRGAASPETCCPSLNDSGITGISDGKTGPAFLENKLIAS